MCKLRNINRKTTDTVAFGMHVQSATSAFVATHTHLHTYINTYIHTYIQAFVHSLAWSGFGANMIQVARRCLELNGHIPAGQRGFDWLQTDNS